MSLQRFSFSYPCKMQGSEEYFPKELQDGALEQNRRIIQIFEYLTNAMTNQIVVDPSILPPMQNGSSDPTDQNIMKTQDVEDAKMFSIISDL